MYRYYKNVHKLPRETTKVYHAIKQKHKTRAKENDFLHNVNG